ncbi:hypothetical protein [Dyella acidisoli]|uniref:hypothetical protein n=1 Tax=Dyella acidisoli TaxID=1867834 RepID=UPI0024E0A696|nr:hypothetical protein [Dyella acidisoli]
MLEDRSWGEHRRDELLEKALKNVGLVVIDIVDAGHARGLSVEWREHFSVKIYGPGEYDYEPVLLSFKNSKVAESLATLDGILALVLLLRRSLDVGNTKFAHQIYRVLEKACYTFGARWRGEAADTWNYVVRTRALAWIPDFEPSAKAWESARTLVLLESKEAKREGRGRPSRSADQVTSGKVERRWRRRILMKACALTDSKIWHVGFQERTRFNEWLTGNRRLIEAHLNWAAYLEYVGGGEDPDYEAQFAKLPSLEIPVDADHSNSYPYSGRLEGHRTEGSDRGMLSMEIPVDDDAHNAD